MRDLKLISIGLLIFLVLPLLATTTVPKQELQKPPRVTFILKDVKKENKMACADTILWCLYGGWGCFKFERPVKCSGEGAGGGGGWAF